MSTQQTLDRIKSIEADTDIGREEKIEELQRIYLDARAEQRALTEGGMGADNPDEDGSEAVLKHAEDALERLDATPHQDDEESAATL